MNTPSTKPTPSDETAAANYENNPFFVATNGIDLLFKKAQSIGIAIAILVGISALSSIPSAFVPPSNQTDTPTQNMGEFPNIPAEVWLTIAVVALIITLIFVVIGIIIRGVLDYSAAKLASGNQVTISEAFRAVFTNFWGYTWVLVVAGVKTLLWTLLLIIPGIIMSVRYSLAGVAYFDKNLKGDASVQHSSQLVKGAWLTTFASQNLLNLITLGIIQPLLVPGTNAVLYRQLTDVEGQKPKAHVLSWLTLILPVILGVVILSVVFFLLWALFNYSQVA